MAENRSGCEAPCEMVIKLDRVIFEGDGKQNPSIMTRLTLTEEAVERISRNSSKLLWIGVATLAGVFGTFLMHALGK